MANNGSFNTSGYSDSGWPDHYTFSWTLSSQSIEGNYSVVSWSLKGAGGANGYRYTTVKQKYVTVNGATQSNETLQNTYNGTTPFSGTATIYHNSDGTGSFSASAGGAFYVYGSYNSTGSGTWSLPTIPRASSITSAANITLGNKCGVTWTPASKDFQYDIKFTLGNWSVSTGKMKPNTTSSYTYNYYAIPANNDVLSQIPYKTTDTMTATLTTYNSSGTQIGSSSSKTFTVTVPSNIVPTMGTITLTPQTYSVLVQGKNKVTASVSGCSAGTGSSIKSYTFSGPGISTTTTGTSVTSGTISNTGTLTYTVTVTDNRGRTASKTATITCHAWSAPSVTLKAYRVGSSTSTTQNNNGEFIRCEYTVKYSYVNGTNAKKSFGVYGGSGASNITYNSWSKTQTTGVDGMVTETGSAVIKSCSSAKTYNIYATISDNYDGKSSSLQITVFGAIRAFNMTSDGMGVAFGKMSEKTNSNANGLFECKWDAKFYGTATGPSGFSTSSDQRVKKNIKDIDIDIVDGLRPVQYELSSVNDGKIHYGFVAQEVTNLLDSVGIDAETTGIVGYIINNGQQEYVLTYTEFVPLLTKKCQDLQSEIDMLKQEINSLKKIIK